MKRKVKKSKKTGGMKFDGGKPNLSLLPIEFLIGVTKAFDFGARKYAADNYREGISHRKLLTSVLRHVLLELAGVKIDHESGNEHWMNAGAGLAMYGFMKTHRSDLDDRYKYTPEQLKLIEQLMYGSIGETK